MGLTREPFAAPTPAWRRGRALVLAVLGVLWIAGGCTTAKPREDPTHIVGNLRFRDADTQAHFQDSYRSGSLYHDFRPVMIADAIFKDERYRALFVRTLQERYLLADADVDEMVRQQQADFDQYFEFLVFLYGGSNVPIKLNSPDTNWKLILRDDDRDVLAPISMQGIKVESPTYRYIQNHFSGLDRWSQAYVVRFPKLEKTLTGEAIGPGPVELLVTGLEGTITMRWIDPASFYRSEGGIAVPVPATAQSSPNTNARPAPEGANAAPEAAIPTRRE